jgi:predicted nucleotidyltransferase
VLREELRARFYRLMRDRVSRMEEDFRVFVEELCRSGLAKEVYLVGSRARGDSMPYSDYDIVLVIGGEIDPLDVVEKVRLTRRARVPLDVVVLREDELRDPVYGEMLKYKRKLC